MAPLEDSSIETSMELHSVACKARDEAAQLQNQICELRVRLEEVEYERSYNAAKANEYEQALQSFRKDHVHEELVRKSLQVAEMSMSLDALKDKMKKLTQENQVLKVSWSRDRSKMAKLSGIVHSLQCSSKEEEEDDDEELELGKEVLSPEKAFDMTLKNLKFYVEFLEEERQNLSGKCKEHEQQIAQLESDLEMKDTKVEMLEELFRSLNRQRQDEDAKQAQSRRGIMEKAKLTSDLFVPPCSRSEMLFSSKRKSSRTVGFMAGRKGPQTAKSVEIGNSQKIQGKKGTSVKIGDKEGVYIGTMKQGKPNGVGTIRFSNGETYLGEVVDGKLEGKGTLYTKNGITRGIFRNNAFVE